MRTTSIPTRRGRRRRGHRLLGSLAAAGLLLAACGGGDDGGEGAGGTEGTGGGGGTAVEGGGTTVPVSDLPPCPADALDGVTEPVELTFWHAMGGDTLEAALQGLTDEYNASQDRVRVTLVNQQGYEDNFDAFRTATPEDRPDLIQLPEYTTQIMTDSGTVLPAASCVAATGFDTSEILDRASSYYTIEGALQAMPFNVSVPVLYYNRSMFEAAGLDPDSPPRTLDELRAASQAIVDSGAATYGIALETGFDSGGGWALEQWFAKADQLYADNENGRAGRATEVLFDDGFGEELFTFLDEMVQDGLAVNVGENAAGTDGLFKLADAQEPAAMTIYTSAGISTVIDVLSGGLIEGFTADQLGIGPMPGPEGGGMTVGGAALWMVQDKPAETIAAAWDYIQFLVSAQSQSTWSVATGYVPINVGAQELAPLSERLTTDPRYAVAYDQLVEGASTAATAGPALGPLREIRTEVARALQSVLSGSAEPAAAIADAAAASDALLEDYANRTGG